MWHGSRRKTSQRTSGESTFTSVESIIKEVILVDKVTRSGTKWDCPEAMDEKLKRDRQEGEQKLMGIGAVPRFLGGSGYSSAPKL